MPNTKNMTTTSRIGHPVNIFYQKQFLKRYMPSLVHAQFGKGVKMPPHVGENVTWRRYTNPSAQTTPLVEGEDPTPVQQSVVDISATIKPYGAYIKESTWFDVTGINQHAAERTEWLSDQAAITIDTLCRDVIAGSASTTVCSNGSGTDTLLNKTDIDSVVETLLGNNAKWMTQLMKAAQGQGTSPIPPAFVAIGHIELLTDLQNVSGWKAVTNYAAPDQRYENEFGSTGMVRWILSTNAYKSGSNYYCPVIAQGAFGNVNMPTAEEMLIHLTPEECGSPLKQYSTYGWKHPYVARILNDALIHTLICTAA